MLGVAALCMAIGYLAVTAVFQFPPLGGKFPALDRLGLLPRWKFFAQGREGIDYAIEIRDRHADGSFGAWSTITITASRRPWTALWNPAAYRAGVLWGSIDTVARRLSEGRTPNAENSLAYSAILRHCRQVKTCPQEADARQFALVRVICGRERSILFTSDFHHF